MIASLLFNINRGKEAEALAPADFMPQIVRPKGEVVARKKKRAAVAFAQKMRALLPS